MTRRDLCGMAGMAELLGKEVYVDARSVPRRVRRSYDGSLINECSMSQGRPRRALWLYVTSCYALGLERRTAHAGASSRHSSLSGIKIRYHVRVVGRCAQPSVAGSMNNERSDHCARSGLCDSTCRCLDGKRHSRVNHGDFW